MFTQNEVQAMRGAAAVDAAGAKIGTVGDVYLDDASGQPAWATVVTGLFGARVRFVPLGGARVEGRRLVLPFGKDDVLSAPQVAEDEHLSVEEESVLYAHYGVSAPTPSAAEVAAEAPEAAEAAGVACPEAPSPAAVLPVPVVPGLGATVPDDEALREARDATEAAHEAANLADPLGDGSYAGDASKSSLVDTPDLEAHDHSASVAATASRAFTVRYEEQLHSGLVLDWGAEEEASLPEGLTAAEVAENDRRAERDSEAAEAKWAAAQGRELPDHEADL